MIDRGGIGREVECGACVALAFDGFRSEVREVNVRVRGRPQLESRIESLGRTRRVTNSPEQGTKLKLTRLILRSQCDRV